MLNTPPRTWLATAFNFGRTSMITNNAAGSGDASLYAFGINNNVIAALNLQP
jgi:hypothetical protein